MVKSEKERKKDNMRQDRNQSIWSLTLWYHEKIEKGATREKERSKLKTTGRLTLLGTNALLIYREYNTTAIHKIRRYNSYIQNLKVQRLYTKLEGIDEIMRLSFFL